MHAVIVDCLEEYLAGALNPADERAVEAHLVSCGSAAMKSRNSGK